MNVSNAYPYTGSIRKQLGLELNGETRGAAERFVTGDLEVKNLSDDVSACPYPSYATVH